MPSLQKKRARRGSTCRWSLTLWSAAVPSHWRLKRATGWLLRKWPTVNTSQWWNFCENSRWMMHCFWTGGRMRHMIPQTRSITWWVVWAEWWRQSWSNSWGSHHSSGLESMNRRTEPPRNTWPSWYDTLVAQVNAWPSSWTVLRFGTARQRQVCDLVCQWPRSLVLEVTGLRSWPVTSEASIVCWRNKIHFLCLNTVWHIASIWQCHSHAMPSARWQHCKTSLRLSTTLSNSAQSDSHALKKSLQCCRWTQWSSSACTR